jgi:hypothetical protein
MRYLLVTEPARGTSVRIDMTEQDDADAALLRWLGEEHEIVVAYRAYLVEVARTYEPPDSFMSYYEDATRDAVQLIDETRHVRA